MPIALTVNGVTYNYPKLGDENWGQDATNWAVGITSFTNTIKTILDNTVLAGVFELADGSAAVPSLRFQNSLSTGLYRVGADVLGFTAAGVAAGQISSSGLLQWKDGSAAAPAFSFSADSNTGIYRIGADQLGFSTAGTLAFTLDASQNALFAANVTATGILTSASVSTGAIGATDITASGNVILGSDAADSLTINAELLGNLVPDVTNMSDVGTTAKRFKDIYSAGDSYLARGLFGNGTLLLPSISFEGDTNTGIYWESADKLAIATGGARRLAISTSRIFADFPISGAAGTAALPQYSFDAETSMGVYRESAGVLAFSTAGTKRFELKAASAIVRSDQLLTQPGTAALPAFSFETDANTGMYRIGADQLGFATNGILGLKVDASQNVTVTGNLIVGGSITLTDLTLTGNTIIGDADTDTVTVNAEFISNLVPDVTNTYDLGTTAKRWKDVFAAGILYGSKGLFGAGTAALPSISFEADTDTGFYNTTNTINFSTAGVNRAALSDVSFQLSLPFRGADGSAATPAISFSADTNTGLYRIGADNIALATNGTKQLDIDTTRVLSSLVIRVPNGAIGTPALAFSTETNTGWYLESANKPALAVAGVRKFAVSSSRFFVDVPLSAPNGAVGAPTYSFDNQTTSGMYLESLGVLAFAAAGVKRLELNSTSTVVSAGQLLVPAGSAAAPSISFTGDVDTGLYETADTINFATAGVYRAALSTASFQLTLPFRGADGSAATPALSFSADANTGLFRKASDSVGFAANGVEVGNYDPVGKWTLGVLGVNQLHDIHGGIRLNAASVTGPSFDALQGAVINDNQVAPAVVFTFTAASNEAIVVHYSLARGTDRETGTMHIVNNGTSADVEVENRPLGTPGVAFTADISGANVRLLYTSSSTGVAGTMKYFTIRWNN